MNKRAEDLIRRYDMIPLNEEGGYFAYNGTFGEGAGNILYLITPTSFSSLHLLHNDEVWYFLEGDDAVQITGTESSGFTETILSKDTRTTIVRRELWQGTRLKEGGEYALFATVMSPRYQDSDYVSPTSDLLVRNPMLKEYIHG